MYLNRYDSVNNEKPGAKDLPGLLVNELIVITQ